MFKEHYPGIYVYENFLTDAEISALFSYLDQNSNEIDWDKSTEEFYRLYAVDAWPDDPDRREQYIAKAIENVRRANSSILAMPIDGSDLLLSIGKKLHFYGYADLTSKGLMGVIKRYTAGGYLGEHHDDETNKEIRSAINFYINDDYDGGELYFKNQDILFRPKANSLVVFPGNIDYTHEVKPVIGDTPRYNITLTTKKPPLYFLDLVPYWS